MESLVAILATVTAVNALAVPAEIEERRTASYASSWDLKEFTSLVVFGDSYSDDSRLGYFIDHEGAAPPVGWENPVVSQHGQLKEHATLFIASLLAEDLRWYICRTTTQQPEAASGPNTSNNTPPPPI